MFKINSKTKQTRKHPESTDERSLKQKDCLCSLRRPEIRHKAKVSNCCGMLYFAERVLLEALYHCGSLHEVLFSSENSYVVHQIPILLPWAIF